MKYNFARDIEVNEKNSVCNNHLWYDYVISIATNWNTMFKMVDMAVANVSDMHVDLSAEAKIILDEYKEKFSPIAPKAFAVRYYNEFMTAVANIMSLSRTNEVKLRKEAFKMIHNTLEDMMKFPFIESEKYRFIAVLEYAHNEILDKLMGN